MLDDEGPLWGWDAICKYMDCTDKTAKKRIEDYNAPVVQIGGSIFSTKVRIDTWMKWNFEKQNGKLKDTKSIKNYIIDLEKRIIKLEEQLIKNKEARNENQD